MRLSSFIFASRVHFYGFLSLQWPIDYIVGVVPSFLHWKTLYINQKISCLGRLLSPILNKRSHTLRQSESVVGTLLMWAQFCQRLKAKSKGRFKKKLWCCFSTLLFLSETKNRMKLKFNKQNSDIIS